MKLPLVNGGFALVDDCDAERLSAFVWRRMTIGYVQTRKTSTYLHHMILGKPPKGFVVDHINHDKLDNRRANLRFASKSLNSHNREKPASNNTSGVVGVNYDRARGRWMARLQIGNKMWSTRCSTFEEAVKARVEAEREMGLPELLDRRAEERALFLTP